MDENKKPKPRIKKVGTHDVTITVVEKTLSSAGNPMLAIVMENEAGESLRHFIVAQGEYWEKNLMKFKNALGLTAADEIEFDKDNLCLSLVGKKLSVVTSWSDNVDKDGFPYIKCKKFLPSGWAEKAKEADNIRW